MQRLEGLPPALRLAQPPHEADVGALVPGRRRPCAAAVVVLGLDDLTLATRERREDGPGVVDLDAVGEEGEVAARRPPGARADGPAERLEDLVPSGRAELVFDDHHIEASAGARDDGLLGKLAQQRRPQVAHRRALEEGCDLRRVAPLRQRVKIDAERPDTVEVIEGAQVVDPPRRTSGGD